MSPLRTIPPPPNSNSLQHFKTDSFFIAIFVLKKIIILWFFLNSRWIGCLILVSRSRGHPPAVYGSVPVDFLRPKFRIAYTKHDVISILMNEYTYINMYIIKKIISCIFILCWDITALLKLKRKFAGYV